MASAKATTDHDEIREWVEKRGGFPAHVKRTSGKGDPGVLRIDYPGYSGKESLERISWDKWFEWFDRNRLAMLIQAGRSRFSKLVSRSTVKKTAAKKTTSKKTSSKKASSKKTSTRKASAKKTAATSSKKTSSKKRSTSAKSRATSSKKTAPRKTASKKATARKSTKRSSGGASVTTTDHNEIRRWVEARGGFPAHVKRTARRNDPGVLRIDYPGYSGTKSLERISWDDWFEAFDSNKLAFLYQKKPNSRFSKLIER